MSKDNKVNPGQYTQAGRLTPDDTARERKKQREPASPKRAEGGRSGWKSGPRVTPKDKQQDSEEE